MDALARSRWRIAGWWALAVGVATEAVTLWLRFRHGMTAAEFNAGAPLLLQIHHMFWSVPLFVIAALAWRSARVSGGLVGVGLGFIVSDLAHHFVILPLTVGNTGWHWP